MSYPKFKIIYDPTWATDAYPFRVRVKFGWTKRWKTLKWVTTVDEGEIVIKKYKEIHMDRRIGKIY